MTFLKIIKDKSNYNLDYEKINLNISNNIKEKYGNYFNKGKSINYKFLKFFIGILVIGLFSFFSKSMFDICNINERNFYMFIDKELVLEDEYDLIVAYGNNQTGKGFSINEIINSNLLDEDSKNELYDYDKLVKKEEYYQDKYIVCLMIVNGEDIIKIVHNIEFGKVFSYESNLDYSFESIINDFNDKFNLDINEEFLNSINRGIVLSFEDSTNGTYLINYNVLYQNKLYVLNK